MTWDIIKMYSHEKELSILRNEGLLLIVLLILLVCACPVYHGVICVYAIRSLDCNFPINTYLLTYLRMYRWQKLS